MDVPTDIDLPDSANALNAELREPGTPGTTSIARHRCFGWLAAGYEHHSGENVRTQATDDQTREEWRELGFLYDLDERRRRWTIRGSRAGLSRLPALLRAYAASPRNEQISEHTHLGPYMYLTVTTAPEPEIRARGISGTLDDLRRLAVLLEDLIEKTNIGDAFAIGHEYAPDSDFTLEGVVEADGFDPAAAVHPSSQTCTALHARREVLRAANPRMPLAQRTPMTTRALAALLTLALTGCFKTTQLRPDALPTEGLERTSGALVVVAKTGRERRFHAPYLVKSTGDGIYVSQGLTPSESFEAAQVDRLEVRTFSEKRTSVLVGVTLGAVFATTLGVALGAAAWGRNQFSWR